MKFRNFGLLLILLAFALSVLGIITLVLLSWIIWIPILIISSPGLIVVYLIIKYTRVKQLQKNRTNLILAFNRWALSSIQSTVQFMIGSSTKAKESETSSGRNSMILFAGYILKCDGG